MLGKVKNPADLCVIRIAPLTLHEEEEAEDAHGGNDDAGHDEGQAPGGGNPDAGNE